MEAGPRMAGEAGGVAGLVRELCAASLSRALSLPSHGDPLLSSMAAPSGREWGLQGQEAREVVRRLLHAAFDLILLRKWVWFGSWDTPLSPVCCCLAYSYEYHRQGRHAEGSQLSGTVKHFMDECEKREGGREGRRGGRWER